MLYNTTSLENNTASLDYSEFLWTCTSFDNHTLPYDAVHPHFSMFWCGLTLVDFTYIWTVYLFAVEASPAPVK